MRDVNIVSEAAQAVLSVLQHYACEHSVNKADLEATLAPLLAGKKPSSAWLEYAAAYQRWVDSEAD